MNMASTESQEFFEYFEDSEDDHEPVATEDEMKEYDNFVAKEKEEETRLEERYLGKTLMELWYVSLHHSKHEPDLLLFIECIELEFIIFSGHSNQSVITVGVNAQIAPEECRCCLELTDALRRWRTKTPNMHHTSPCLQRCMPK